MKQAFKDIVGEPVDSDASNSLFSAVTLLALNNRDLARKARDSDSPSERAQLLEQMIAQAGQIANLSVILDHVVRTHHEATLNRAITDPLTGIHNRAYFDPAFEEARATAEITGAPLALLTFDIDHFKSVNDNHGHGAGDNVLKIFAGQIRKGVKDTDIVARYGGEEFMVLLPDTAHDVAMRIANRLRASVKARKAQVNAPAITVSGGLTMMRPGDTAQTIKDRADQALYVAKNNGRDRIVSTERTYAQKPRLNGPK